jgi:hypothetical protein
MVRRLALSDGEMRARPRGGAITLDVEVASSTSSRAVSSEAKCENSLRARQEYDVASQLIGNGAVR